MLDRRNKVKKHLVHRSDKTVTTIDSFLEEISAYHITDFLKESYQERVNEAYQTAQATNNMQVVMGEGDLFFVVLPNSIVITCKALDYYDLLTDKELEVDLLEEAYKNQEITFKEFRTRLISIKEG